MLRLHRFESIESQPLVKIMNVSFPPKDSIEGWSVPAPVAPDFSRLAFCLQGLLCDVTTMDEAQQRVIASIRAARRCSIVTPNANFLRMIRSDPEVRDAVLASDLSLIDGMPLVWFARMLGIAVPGRVCGSDLLETLMRQTNERFGAFLFGATDEIGERVRDRLAASPGIRCTGRYSPGFGSVDSMSRPDIFDTINRTAPDILVLAAGARKSLLWLGRNEHRLSTPVICYLGAAINFVAGSVKRAPVQLRRCGLEWLWRLKEEPALWSRYALDLLTLLSVLFRQLLPCLIDSAIHRSSATASATRLQLHHGMDLNTMTFSGVWTKDNLAPACAALTAATRRPGNLVIDLDGATFVDAAFLGQVLIAYGYQKRIHQGFVLRASGERIRRILRLHGCGYLLQAGQEQPEARSVPSPLEIAANHSVRELWQRTIRVVYRTTAHSR